jgi:signal transduction histidine kinase
VVSPNFKKNPPINSIFQEKNRHVKELSLIVDLDDLQNLKTLRSFYSRIISGESGLQAGGKDLLTLKFTKVGGGHYSYILKTVPCSILTTKKYNFFLVLFEPLGLTSINPQQDIVEQLSKDYLSIIAHELRNSLVTASGYISLLKKSHSTNDNKTLARYEVIKKRFSKMEVLVDKISLLTRHQKQEQPLELGEVSIFMLITQVVDNLKLFLLMKNIKLELSILPPEDIVIRADEELLKLAVENILHNSIKYSSAGSLVTMSCYTTNGVRKEPELVFEITDRGVGIPAAEFSGIFTPNFRASNVFDIQGEGVGLYHANRIIKQHDGKLEVFSEGMGRGTKVKITIRLPGKIEK